MLIKHYESTLCHYKIQGYIMQTSILPILSSQAWQYLGKPLLGPHKTGGGRLMHQTSGGKKTTKQWFSTLWFNHHGSLTWSQHRKSVSKSAWSFQNPVGSSCFLFSTNAERMETWPSWRGRKSSTIQGQHSPVSFAVRLSWKKWSDSTFLLHGSEIFSPMSMRISNLLSFREHWANH